jgi:hypothetical protein
MRRPDTVSLILGLLATPLALAGLWLSFGGHLGWNTVKIAGPVILVLIGIIGLVVSRSRQ